VVVGVCSILVAASTDLVRHWLIPSVTGVNKIQEKALATELVPNAFLLLHMFCIKSTYSCIYAFVKSVLEADSYNLDVVISCIG
jgi:hypothetical protein